MIKQLINDIAFDTIKLSQALTRAKIVENKIKNDTFKKWLRKELEGYKFVDQYLPEYRKVRSAIYLTAEFPYGQTQTFPVELPDEFGAETLDLINYHRIIEPISIVEEQISSFTKPSGSLTIPNQQIQMLASLFKEVLEETDGTITHGARQIGKVQYQNVLEQTKQKLLDTLMELEEEFPNLLNDEKMSKEDNEKVQNIVTNHIYGNNNPMNIATGVSVKQNVKTSVFTVEQEEKLKSLGVEEADIKDLKHIVEYGSNDKSTLISKSMKWLGSVSASVAGRGLYEKIPAITDFIHKLTM